MKNYVTLSLLLVSALNGMETDDQEKPLKVFVIPGQNQTGLEPYYVVEYTGISSERIQRVTTPYPVPVDSGQSDCMQELENALQDNKGKFIVYANSQGTATALNFFPQHPEHADKCKGMVLESVLGSGNSVIYHTITSPIFGFPKLKGIPGLYYLAPYFAKIALSHNSPVGDQPIKSVANLNIDGPIIIVHSKKDPQLSYKDACAIYYALRKNGKNAYLISKEGAEHIDILGYDTTVKNILRQHGIIPKKEEDDDEKEDEDHVDQFDTRSYQPNHESYKADYDELTKKEQKITQYGPWPLRLTITGVFVGFAAIIWFLNKKLRTV